MLDLFIREAALDGGGDLAAPEPAEPAAAVEPGEAPGDVPEEPRTYSEEEYNAAVRQAAYDAAEETLALAQSRMPQFDPRIAGATPGPMSGYPAQPVPPGFVPVPELDPFDPDSIAAYNDARETNQMIRMSMLMQQQIGPVAQTFEQQREQEILDHGNEIAESMVADAIASGKDVTDEGRAMIRPIADQLFPSFAERFGESPRASEAAIYAATEHVRKWEAAVAERARTTQANELSTLANAPVEPGAAAAASPLPGTPQRYESPEAVKADLLRRFAT